MGNHKPQLCAGVCLEKASPKPQRVKARFEKKKRSAQKSSHSGSPESGQIFQKTRCPLATPAVCNSLLHQRGTLEASKSAQNSVSCIIIFVFFYFSFSQAIFRIILGANHPPSWRLSMKTAVYLLNSCKDKAPPLFQQESSAVPFSSSYQMFR